MEDNLKISKVEYLSNHFLDHFQILNLDLYHILQILKWKQPPMEDVWLSPACFWTNSYIHLQIKIL